MVDSHSWVHRRVDRLELESSGSLRRHVSVDLTPPARLGISGSKDRIQIPLGLARKGPLRGFDARGDEGPLPLLEAGANGELALDLLLSLARRAFDRALPARPEFEAACRAVVFTDFRAELPIGFGSANEAADRGRRLQVLADLTMPLPPGVTMESQQGFLAFARRLSESFLMIVEVPEGLRGTRTIVKYSYLEETLFPLNDRHPRVKCRLGDFGFAQSVHFEFVPPNLLSLTRVEIWRGLAVPTGSEVPVLAGESVLHLAMRPRNRLETGSVELEFALRREGVVATAFFGSAVMLAVVASAIVLRSLRPVLLQPHVTVAASSAGALLALGSALLTWVARAPEDRTVSAVLARPRRLLWGSAASAAATAGLLAVPFVGWFRTICWWLLLIGQLFVVMVAARVRHDSPPSDVRWPLADQEV